MELISRYLIIENIKVSKIFKIETVAHKDGYVITSRKCLQDFMPVNAFKSLLKQGLYMTEKAKNSSYDNKIGLHRLNLCLYVDITGISVHHIDKNKQNNYILNLLPISSEKIHTELDHSDPNLELACNLQKDFKRKIFKTKNQTIASNDEIILEILNLKVQGLKTNAIIKKLKSKIKKSSVYKIIKEFFYAKDFLNAIKNGTIRELSEFDGKTMDKWEYIKAFEDL